MNSTPSWRTNTVSHSAPTPAQNAEDTGLWARFRRPLPPPEENVRLRLLCALTTVIASCALLDQLEWPGYSLPVIIASLLGSYLSYRNRNHNQVWLKVFITIFMLWTLRHFFGELAASATDPRVPLAKLLILLHCGHCYDVPRRRDLNYSLLVTLVLMAVAAVITESLSYGIYLAAFSASSSAAWFCCCQSAAREQYGPAPTPTTPTETSPQTITSSGQLQASFWPTAGKYAAITLLVSAVILTILPRTSSLGIRYHPMSLGGGFGKAALSWQEMLSPGQSLAGSSNWSLKHRLDEDELTSLRAIVDLNQRYDLSDAPVMNVRTDCPSYYKRLSFSKYRDNQWIATNDEIHKRAAPSQTFILKRHFDPQFRDKLYIFHILSDQPNLVLLPAHAYQLYFPANEIYLTDSATVLAPINLEQGTVYSAVALEITRDQLVTSMRNGLIAGEYESEYYKKMLARQLPRELQLPSDLPKRCYTLAASITRNLPNNLFKVQALANYLRTNYTYQSVPPAYPSSVDTVDYFLFESKIGNCQHFASALAILARTQGIPTRFINGFLPGLYNPLTGIYEVKESDAHAWCEAMCVGDHHWLTVDATPAADGSEIVYHSSKAEWLPTSMITYLKAMLSPEWRLRLSNFADFLLEHLTAITVTFTLAAVVLWLSGRVRGWKKNVQQGRQSLRWTKFNQVWCRANRILGKLGLSNTITSQESIVSAYREMSSMLSKRGFANSPNITARQQATQAYAKYPWPEILELTGLFENVAYSREQGLNSLDPKAAARADQALTSLKQHLAQLPNSPSSPAPNSDDEAKAT